MGCCWVLLVQLLDLLGIGDVVLLGLVRPAPGSVGYWDDVVWELSSSIWIREIEFVCHVLFGGPRVGISGSPQKQKKAS